MVGIILLIQANMQRSIAASMVLCKTVRVKRIDMALIETPWNREGCIMGLNIPGNVLFFASRI